MPKLADRVQETSATTGTGTFSLAGAATGFRSFNSAFTNGDIVFYAAQDTGSNWEVGYGTVGTATLTRTVIESSNANALVSFPGPTTTVFCTAPALSLPADQTSNSGKYLTTNGTTTSWGTVSAGLTLSNDTTTSTNIYPLFASATSGTATTVYTGNANLLYKPSTGELQAQELIAANGLVVNSATVATSYSIPSGNNAMSAGPVAISSGQTVTVPSGSIWVIV